MLILRLKQAESALAAGRLDEAYGLLQADDVRSHRRGQDLVTGLVATLVQRGREHLDAGRLVQATGDGVKAAALAGNSPQVGELQAAIAAAGAARHEGRERRAAVAAAIRGHVHDGRLSTAEGLLDHADADSGLGREVTARREALAVAETRVRRALDREDWDDAIDQLLSVKRSGGWNEALMELAARTTASVSRCVGDAINRGRLDLADALLPRLTSLGGASVETDQWGRIVELCRQAAGQVEDGRLGRALRVLRRLTAAVPEAEWIDAAIEQASRAAEAVEDLHAGPLGWCMGGPHDDADAFGEPDMPATPVPAGGENRPALARRFGLQVDGVGSFLVVRDGRVTVGPGEADVTLAVDPSLPTVRIERSDEDYFLSCEKAVQVNGQATTKKLLSNGDRIALAARCRMRFRVPNPASTSAALDLSGVRLARGDAKRVILMDQTMVIGPQASSHIRAGQLDESVVLYVRGDRMFCRTDSPVTVDGRPMDRSVGISLGQHVRIGPVGLVMTEVGS